ncbi:MAG: multiubiquitin domain-containing protein [Deltaproteobacteria bacterium]|nr:multiubiquitin domain-containing protein [Deltaproteobacteria bacterium]
MSNDENKQPEITHDEVDIEEYAKRGEAPPNARRYRIRVDREKHTVTVPKMSGRDLLKLAGKVPPERFSLTQKFRGGAVKPVGLDDTVVFTTPGVECFMTLPLDQTEG